MDGKERSKKRISDDWKSNKVITLLLTTGAVYFFLRYLSPLVAPILTAMLFVTMFGPFLQKIQEKLHLHRQIGAILLLLLGFAILALVIWVLFSWMVGSLPKWIGRIEELEQKVRLIVYNGSHLAGHALGIDGEYLGNTLLKYVEQGFSYFQDKAVPDMLVQSLEYMKAVAAVSVFLVTFLIAAVLLARDYDRIMNNLLEKEEFHVLLEVICGVIRYIATFVKAQLIIMSVIAAISALTLTFAGIEHGALWGLLAGVLDALPFIGTGVVLFPLALSRIFCGKLGGAVICAVLYAVCAFLREMLEPRLIGSRLGVPPIAVLVSVYAGVRLFGVWGIIKGPLGFVLIYQTCFSIWRRSRPDKPL